MCGITGFINYKNSEREQILKAMCDAIAHRGPDGDGQFLVENIGLAHRRLSIIDLNTGDQPMFSSDKRYVTVFNGEIYNYRELREELKSERCEFRTTSDTEVIAESIRAWGIRKAVLKFRGMFSFAVYDFKDKKLLLARDRTGIKPLYYSEKPQGFFFASEQKALLNVPEISRKINPVAIHDFLTLGFPVTPESCWQDINMFPPAHFMEIKLGEKPKLMKYWQWEYAPESMTLDGALEEVGNVLKNSLKYHLRSDVPLAAFLSGGIDSSLLVTFLAKGGLIDGLQTFNVGFDEEKYDESDDAEHVAQLAGTEHTKIRMRGGEGKPEEFEKILSQYDEPYADSSCLPTYMISGEMRKHVKVVISGDGGDEFFGGYDRFINVGRIAALKNSPFKGLIKTLLGLGSPFIGNEYYRKFNNALKMAGVSEKEMFCLLHTYFPEEEKNSLYLPEFAKLAKTSGPTWERMGKYVPEQMSNIGSGLMDTEIALNLHADYLRKVDIASSAHGLEVRVPFLDSEVMDFAARVPMDLKVHSRTLKYLLRELTRKNISDRIADKRKWGFGIPFDRWCGAEMQDYLRDLLFSEQADSGIWQMFHKKEGMNLWDKFIKPGKVSYKNVSRFQIYQRLFIFAATQIWFKKYKPEISYTNSSGPKRKINSKRILCVIGQLGNGGSEKQLYLFLKHLDKERFSASVFITGPEGGIWSDRIRKELGIELVFTGDVSIPSKMYKYRQELKKKQPDVIFSWSFFTNPLIVISKGINFVGSLRQQFSQDNTSEEFFRRSLAERPKKIIVNSNSILEEFEKTGMSKEKIKVIFNIFEAEPVPASVRQKSRRNFYKKHKIPEDSITVIGVGRNSKVKNFGFFVDVVKAARKKEPKIYGILVGSGGDGQKDYINELGLKEYFTITGEIPSAEEALNASDIFMLSSKYEGLPNVLIEGINAGCAPLATDVGGVRDIYSEVPDDLLGKILIEDYDVDKAADKLINLARDEQLRNQVVEYSRKFLAQLTPQNVMEHYYEVLNLN